MAISRLTRHIRSPKYHDRLITTFRNYGSSSSSSASESSKSSDSVNSGNPNLRVFEDNATKWWSGSEFKILRAMNEIRVPYIVEGLGKPIAGAKLMDVGCGGGLLSEPLARLGADVVGIDPVFESINQAQLHSQNDPSVEGRLKFKNCNIEDLSSLPEHTEAYDALIASEVVEHIEDVEQFLVHCSKVIKPNGSLYVTTINQTPLSWLGVIFMGEYVLRQLPRGTHTYDMFVSVKGLRVMLERLGFHIRRVNGFMYEPIQGKFYWTPTTLTHYALQAIKSPQASRNFGNSTSVDPKSTKLNHEQRRCMSSKASKSKARVEVDEDEIGNVVQIDDYKIKCVDIVREFSDHIDNKLSTRANIASIETLKVTLEGLSEPLELRDIAQISMKGSNLIVINLSTMPEAVKPTMDALSKFENLSTQAEVNNIYATLPRVSREHREQLVAQARKAAHEYKQKLRDLQSKYKGLAGLAKGKGISEDLKRSAANYLLALLRDREAEIDTMLKKKSDQLLNQK